MINLLIEFFDTAPFNVFRHGNSVSFTNIDHCVGFTVEETGGVTLDFDGETSIYPNAQSAINKLESIFFVSSDPFYRRFSLSMAEDFRLLQIREREISKDHRTFDDHAYDDSLS